jgi:hypothetical protein
MNAFHGNPQLKTRLEERARMIESQFRGGLRNLKEGEYAWQVQRNLMPLIPPVANEMCDDFAVRAAAHEQFAAELGIPARVAFLYRGLFEDMHESVSPAWPRRFARTVAVGTDLSTVWRDFALFVLSDPKVGLALYAQTGEQAKAIEDIITLFTIDSDQAESWQQAARAASQASQAGHRGHGKSAKECLESVGSSAAHAAAQFAYAFCDARYAEDAVKWSAWPLRHMEEYRHFAEDEKYVVRADSRGMVNVGEALYASAMNFRDFRAAAQRGEEARWQRYSLYCDKLVELIKKRAPRRPGMFGRLFSGRLFGWR